MTGIPRRPSLVGREAELAALDEQVALARAGAFRVVLVTGEPGIGKSRLVNELAERQRDPAVVLRSARRALGSGPGKPDSELDHEPGRDPDPERLLRALTELLDNLSADSPVIVVLDDVHNADASSWQALYHMARRLPDRPVLVLAAARTADLAR